MILHIDEFQYSATICKLILKACKTSIKRDWGVRFLPVFSGLSDHLVTINAEETESLSSTWRQKNIRMNPSPIAPFYARVMDKLELGKVERIPLAKLPNPVLQRLYKLLILVKVE